MSSHESSGEFDVNNACENSLGGNSSKPCRRNCKCVLTLDVSIYVCGNSELDVVVLSLSIIHSLTDWFCGRWWIK